MTRRSIVALAVASAVGAGGAALASPSPARGLNLAGSQCLAAGPTPGACSLVGGGGDSVLSGATNALTAVTLGALVAWVVDGAKYVLHATTNVLGETTAPQLTSTWFSSTYWRVAGIAAVLTLPFLFAAAVQALIRSDLGLLIRAALGYLPVAVLAVAIAAPLTMLLLAASDQMSAIVSSAAGNQSGRFLADSTGLIGLIATSFSSPFVMFLIALLIVAGALLLWVELLVREAAVYVIVLMLPLAFAAFVWPARRIWAIRSIELLIALVLSKFAIVAVLSLGGAALEQSANRSLTGLLAAGVLISLAAFAPWAMLRLIPLAEIAGAAAGSLSAGSKSALHRLAQSDAWAAEGVRWASKTAQMRDAADEATSASGGGAAVKDLADSNIGAADLHSAPEDSRPNSSAGAERPLDGQAQPGDTGAAERPLPPVDSSWGGDRPALDIQKAAPDRLPPAGPTEPAPPAPPPPPSPPDPDR